MVRDVLRGVADNIIATYDKNRPEILVKGGMVGLVIAGIGAAVAAYKARPIVDEIKDDIRQIEKVKKEGVLHKASDPSETIPYTKKDAQKDTVKVLKTKGLRVIFAFLIPVLIVIASCAAICNGVDAFKAINAELAGEVARLTAALAACEKQLANTAGKEEVLNAKYEETDSETGEKIFKAPEDGQASNGTFFIKLDLRKCPDVFWNTDFNDRIALLKSVELTAENYIWRHINTYGACILDAWEVMNMIGCVYGNDVDWRNTHRAMRYIFRRGDAVKVDFGLEEAEDLMNFGKAPKDEVWLHINFNEGVSKPSPRVVKG